MRENRNWRGDVGGLRGLQTSAPKARLGLCTPFGRTGLVAFSSTLHQMIAWGLTCQVLQKYAATQKMTGNEQARSGHFCLCGYAADAALTAKAVISGAGTHRSLAYNACKSGVGMRSRPRIAQRFRKRRLTTDQACLYLTADVFFIAPDASLLLPHKLNWRKLLESVFKPVRQDGSRV